MSDKFRNRFRISSSRASWWDYGNGSYFVTICTRNRSHFFGEILDNVFYPTPIGNIAENYWREIPDRFPYARLGDHVIMPNHVHGIVTIRRRFIDFPDVETRSIDFPDVFPDVETRSIDFPDVLPDVETRSIDFPDVLPDVETRSIDFPDVLPDVETRSIDFPDVLPDVETRLIASLHPVIHPVIHPEIHPEIDPENESENISKSHRGGITGLHNPMLHQNLSRVIRWYTGRVSYESHKINPEFNWQRRFHDRIIRDRDEYKIKTRYIQKNILNWKEDEFY